MYDERRNISPITSELVSRSRARLADRRRVVSSPIISLSLTPTVRTFRSILRCVVISVNLEEILDLSLSLQDYHLQEVTLYAKQGRTLGSALSSQDIMALQRQEERRRQQAKQSVFGFMFKKSKESSVSTDSLEGRSVSPARSDETGRSASPLQPPTRPQRKRRLAPKPPTSYDREQQRATTTTGTVATTARGAAAAAAGKTNGESSKEKMLIGHSRNSSDSSGYHEASVLSDNPDSAGRLPETLPRRNRTPGTNETPRKLVHTSQSSKSLGNLAVTASGTSLDRALSSSSLSSTGKTIFSSSLFFLSFYLFYFKLLTERTYLYVPTGFIAISLSLAYVASRFEFK